MVEGSSPPVLVIVDSVQTMRSSASSSAAGSVGQIRDSTALFVQLAKLTGRHLCHLYELIRNTIQGYNAVYRLLLPLPHYYYYHLHYNYYTYTGSAVLLAGHVTKSGEVAGPRILEHMVDTGATIELFCTM